MLHEMLRSTYPGKYFMLQIMEGSVVILPTIILIAFATCFLIFLIRYFRRSPYGVIQTIVAWINLCLTRILWRVEVQGQLPEKNNRGGVIVCLSLIHI